MVDSRVKKGLTTDEHAITAARLAQLIGVERGDPGDQGARGIGAGDVRGEELTGEVGFLHMVLSAETIAM